MFYTTIHSSLLHLYTAKTFTLFYTLYTANIRQSLGNQLADQVAVRLACREGAVVPVVFEKLAGVGEVEVPGKEKRVF